MDLTAPVIHLARMRFPRVIHRHSPHPLSLSLHTGFIDGNGETESISVRGALRAC